MYNQIFKRCFCRNASNVFNGTNVEYANHGLRFLTFRLLSPPANKRQFTTLKPFEDKEKGEENVFMRDEEKRLVSDIKARVTLAKIVTKHNLSDTIRIKIMNNYDKIMRLENGQKVKKSDILVLLQVHEPTDAKEREIIAKLNY